MVVAREVTSGRRVTIKFDLGQAPDLDDYGRPFRPNEVQVWTSFDAAGKARAIIFAHGPQVLKSGQVGRAQRTQAWVNDDKPPLWVRDLIEQYGKAAGA